MYGGASNCCSSRWPRPRRAGTLCCMNNLVVFEFEDSERTIEMTDVPVPPQDSEIYIDDVRYYVDDVVLSYWPDNPDTSVMANVRIRSVPERADESDFG